MSDALAPIADKLRRLARLLSSDRDGEIVAAARALNRTLKSAGLDIHSFADSIGRANGKFTEADALEIYQRGVEDGRHEAEREGTFRDVNENKQPSWHTIAVECSKHPGRLRNDRERAFVQDMVARTVRGGKLTEKQSDWLRACYARVRR
jgi:hypothetical protein